ncbi:PAS-domain containing protein [Magnetospirillum gryphiswaldense]|uniref:PAS-domain containing protein n=1 Tax=Magnetospirillum gryphiswaldense TaxID=55518 RepID=UPI00032459DE|nr:PAS-domain containing protein [Magnetospirillum gryphiswaldense]AVM72942.1 Non-motile and phage-resistance protein [Magnetospirillum gryphiswaldense MSR-1]AVM76845.1 Non-motile and phage-resistance protein [Magnetospirillum gryphiswaldense]
MDLTLQAALLGTVMGAAVLTVVTLYGWTLPNAPKAFGWWAAAFLLETLSRAVLIPDGLDIRADLSDGLHALAAGLSLCGAVSLGGRPVSGGLLIGGLQVAMTWGLLVHLGRANGLLPLDLPVLGLGGGPLLLAAWHFRAPRLRGGHQAPNTLASIAFALHGLVLLASPVLNSDHAIAVWGFFVAQLLSVLMALALLLEVLMRQQAVAESEGQRANLLQSRLVDALSSVQDGVALFDPRERLVTANDLYRQFMAPVAEIIKPGRLFQDIVDAEFEMGVVRQECEVVRSGKLADHAVPAVQGCEAELFDGRWVSINVYPTADGGYLRILRDVTARRQVTASLHDSVTWLRGIMNTVVDGIITIDDTASILSFNAAAERIFGYGADETVGRNVSMLMPEPYHSEHDDYMRRYAETGEARVIGIGRQVKGKRKDGTVFPLELAVTRMNQGGLITYIGLVRDITDRKRVEDALVESEQRFRDLAESASDWFWELDADLRFTFVSGRVRQVLGVGPGYFIGRPFSDLATSCEDPRDWDVQQSLIRGRRPFRGFIFVHPMPSGAVKFVEMAGRPAFDADGKFDGYRGTAADITPLKRHEQELATQSAMRQTIIDNMGQGVVVFDGDERLVALNSHARQLLDLPETEIETGTSNLEALLLYLAVQGEFGHSGAIMVKVQRRLARLRRDPRRVFEHARPNGSVLEIRSTAMPGGGLILTFTDITDRKKVEVTLREARDAAERGNRAKATFLANISHELRTPLNAIIGFSELMKHEIFGPLQPPAYRSYVDDVHESGMHLLELINDILDMSKAEAGMTDLVESPVDVAAVVRASLRMMDKRASANGISLEADLPDGLAFLRADERRIRQILLNLLSNAVKFTDDGGMVRVTAQVDGRGMVIEVIDTGIGMTPEDMDKVMEPFVQADTRLSRKYEGTGLGLPLTKALVNAHGGTMELHSIPDHGTTVTVTFPPERVIDDTHLLTTEADESWRRG